MSPKRPLAKNNLGIVIEGRAEDTEEFYRTCVSGKERWCEWASQRISCMLNHGQGKEVSMYEKQPIFRVVSNNEA